MSLANEPTVLWLPQRQQPLVPWRNGGGSTRQIAIDPPSATVQGFRWRISIASVAADGPFSRFPGIDRRLWLLAGAGMELDVEGRLVRLDRPLQRFDFTGEATVEARLLVGPTEDLSVMTDRATVDASVEILELRPVERLQRTLPDAQHIVLAIAGALTVPRLNGELGERDAVQIDGALVLELEARPAPATVLLASFTARRSVPSLGPRASSR